MAPLRVTALSGKVEARLPSENRTRKNQGRLQFPWKPKTAQVEYEHCHRATARERSIRVSELVVEACLDHLDVWVHRDSTGLRANTAREGPALQIEPIIFNLGSPVVGEGIFNAAAHQQTAVRVAPSATPDESSCILNIHARPAPAVTDLAVEQRAIPCKAQARRYRRQPIPLADGLHRMASDGYKRARLLAAGEVEITFDPEHECACLVIEPKLAAADELGITPGPGCPKICGNVPLSPGSADIAADIETRPCEQRRDDHWRRGWRRPWRQIGGLRC